MVRQKEGKHKSEKKAPAKTPKEKKAAKAIKRQLKNNADKSSI